MRIPEPEKREHRESIIPMINVVFLLLIFFLMTAAIEAPEPFEVLLPAAEEREVVQEADARLFVSAEGAVAFLDFVGETAVEEAARAYAENPDLPFEIRADAGLEGFILAQIFRRLSDKGIRNISLVTSAP